MCSFLPKLDLGFEGFGDLLAAIRIRTHLEIFILWYENILQILATAYIRHEPWEMGVHKRNGVLYLDVHKLLERPQSDLDP
ncbi:unnamed protein product, partial [Vitis vinifera]|uniref:Uncharacterized protein n=1 Tax=Vitis vinifera TaxID=29760 RepID=D7TYH4_VITVI